jgi:hypothetical protein
MSKIYFRFNYRTDQKRKVEDFIADYKLKAGIEIEELKIERYWKEKDQMQATFMLQPALTGKEETIFLILKLANILGTSKFRWTFNGPQENEHLSFSCIFNNDNHDEPLTWANIELGD